MRNTERTLRHMGNITEKVREQKQKAVMILTCLSPHWIPSAKHSAWHRGHNP